MPRWAEMELEDALGRLDRGHELRAACRLVLARSRAFPDLASTPPMQALALILRDLEAAGPGPPQRALEERLRAPARDAGTALASLVWPNLERRASPAPFAYIALVGARLFERSVLEQVLATLSARPTWAPTRWGYSESPNRDLVDREDVVGWAEGMPRAHALTLGRGRRRVPYEASLNLGHRPALQIRVREPRIEELRGAFELLFELARATRAHFGWASLQSGFVPPFPDAEAGAVYTRESHVDISRFGYWSGGPGGLAARTWIGSEYLSRLEDDPLETFPGVVQRFEEGAGVDLAPEPWLLRGPFLDHVWRRGMAHLAPSGLFATVHVERGGMVMFEPGRFSAPKEVR